MVTDASKNAPAEPTHRELHPYDRHDPIPVPEVVESDSDTAWGRWEDSIAPASKEDEPAFDDTVPMEPPLLTSTKPAVKP